MSAVPYPPSDVIKEIGRAKGATPGVAAGHWAHPMYNCALRLFRLRNNLARNEDDFEGRNLAVLEWKITMELGNISGVRICFDFPEGLGP